MGVKFCTFSSDLAHFSGVLLAPQIQDPYKWTIVRKGDEDTFQWQQRQCKGGGDNRDVSKHKIPNSTFFFLKWAYLLKLKHRVYIDDGFFFSKYSIQRSNFWFHLLHLLFAVVFFPVTDEVLSPTHSVLSNSCKQTEEGRVIPPLSPCHGF